MTIAGGFVTSREHVFDDLYYICARCAVTRSDIMNGKADWECKALDNVVALHKYKRMKRK